MVEQSQHYLIRKKYCNDRCAVIRVSSGMKIEKLAGSLDTDSMKLDISWEGGYPFFSGCRQKILNPSETREYVSYFKRKEKEKKD